MLNRRLHIVPIRQKAAFSFVKEKHRHHRAPVGSVFQIACECDGQVVGVVICGRPSSRHQDDGLTLEVTRLCTDGTYNACSMLYSASWRAAKNLGYKRLITYILKSEEGTSLYAANWKLIGEAGGGTWCRNDRHRVDKHPIEKKLLFEAK